MTELLKKIRSYPLEREYEGWVTYQIEEYFDSLLIKADIWAVSPDDEVNWPADEHLVVGSKLVGLQFKKPQLVPTTTGTVNYDRLKWSFHNPNGQFDLVQKRSEIFYCLPTFLNRKWRKQALDHCLFWRPDKTKNYNAWYNNQNARTPYNQLEYEPRWGLFVERLLSCKIGKLIDSFDDARMYIKSLLSDLRELPLSQLDESKSVSAPGPLEVYLLSIQITS